MSDNSMLYVIKDIEGMSSNRENDRKQAMKGLQNILKFSEKLPENFDADREREKAGSYASNCTNF